MYGQKILVEQICALAENMDLKCFTACGDCMSFFQLITK